MKDVKKKKRLTGKKDGYIFSRYCFNDNCLQLVIIIGSYVRGYLICIINDEIKPSKTNLRFKIKIKIKTIICLISY